MKKLFLAYLLIALIASGCSSDDSNPNPGIVGLDDQRNNFTWKAMNSWYNWQENVPNLADSKDDNVDEYVDFLNGYSSPQALFDALLFDKGNTDRFSWFIEDYVAQQQAFQGITKSFGLRFQAVEINSQGDVILYVRYVAPDSPASIAGMKRGDIINALDGVVLTSSNYNSTISKLSNDAVTFTTVESDGKTSVEDKTITSVVLAENPVHFTKVFDDIGGKKVGYLVYNGFRSSYNDELNAAFASLKNEGIQELVLDLRLNGGGSVLTSSYLASMINAGAADDRFAELRYNSKHSNRSGFVPFDSTLNIYNSDGVKVGEEAINRLSGLSQVYILTSGSTASASEMIINGLSPFMSVKLIGSTTFGKNVGSITLYDAPSSDYTDVNAANTAHKNAMQPIVFQIFNKLGQSDYTLGFEPDTEVLEYQFWDNILPFGDENEVVLKAALDDIRGFATKSTLKPSKEARTEGLKVRERQFEKEMYIENDFYNN